MGLKDNGKTKPRLRLPAVHVIVPCLAALLLMPAEQVQARLASSSKSGGKPSFEDRTARLAEARTVPIRYKAKDARGWEIAETPNFRIYHNQSRALVSKVARVAEQTRELMMRRWLGTSGEAWDPPCQLYLHASRKDYWKIKAISGKALGHSVVRADGDQVTSRYIEVFYGQTDLLTTVLPHEVTHVVVSSFFGERRIPNWAAEGTAMLSEAPDEIARNLRTLKKFRSELYSLRTLMETQSYPDENNIALYYLQSTSLLDFLVSERGEQVFIRYLQDALKHGYEAALRSHYGFKSFEELEQQWLGQAFGESRPSGDGVS